jgi:hypothetical protein
MSRRQGNAELVYFQGPASRRRRSVPPLLSQLEVPGAEVQTEAALQRVSSTDIADLVEKALDASHLTKAFAAGRMGISLSLFVRQLQNIDNQHLSLQRLYRLPDAFWVEFWLLVIKRRKLARVRRRVIFEAEA